MSNRSSCCSLLPSCQSSLVKSCHCRLDFSIQVLFSFSFLDFYQVDLLNQFSMPPLISQILKRRTVNWKFSTVLLFENQHENKHNITFEIHLKIFALNSTRQPQGCSTARIFEFVHSFISILHPYLQCALTNAMKMLVHTLSDRSAFRWSGFIHD